MVDVFKPASGKAFHNELLQNQWWLKIGGVALILSSLLVFSIFYLDSNVPLIIGFTLAAIVMLVQAIKFWLYKWLGLSLHIMAGLLDGFIAIAYGLSNDFLLAIALCLLGVSFFIIGIFRLYISSSQGVDYLGWGWTFFCGLINLLLVVVITMRFLTPYATVSLIAGIDFLVTGIALLGLGFGANQVAANQFRSL